MCTKRSILKSYFKLRTISETHSQEYWLQVKIDIAKFIANTIIQKRSRCFSEINYCSPRPALLPPCRSVWSSITDQVGSRLVLQMSPVRCTSRSKLQSVNRRTLSARWSVDLELSRSAGLSGFPPHYNFRTTSLESNVSYCDYNLGRAYINWTHLVDLRAIHQISMGASKEKNEAISLVPKNTDASKKYQEG